MSDLPPNYVAAFDPDLVEHDTEPEDRPLVDPDAVITYIRAVIPTLGTAIDCNDFSRADRGRVSRELWILQGEILQMMDTLKGQIFSQGNVSLFRDDDERVSESERAMGTLRGFAGIDDGWV